MPPEVASKRYGMPLCTSAKNARTVSANAPWRTMIAATHNASNAPGTAALVRLAIRRSSQPVSAVASTTAGSSMSSAKKALFVAPSSTEISSSRSARPRRARACRRSRPCTMILAIIESNSGAMTTPSATPESTRMPGPSGGRNTRTRPGLGWKSRSGSSALRRTSMAWPRGS